MGCIVIRFSTSTLTGCREKCIHLFLTLLSLQIQMPGFNHSDTPSKQNSLSETSSTPQCEMCDPIRPKERDN